MGPFCPEDYFRDFAAVKVNHASDMRSDVESFGGLTQDGKTVLMRANCRAL